MQDKQQYKCIKCGFNEFESDRFHATGGNLAKLLDVQNKKFITISCKQCGYTELYKEKTKDGWNILDFLIG